MEDGNTAALRQHEAEEAYWDARMDRAEKYRDTLVDLYINNEKHEIAMHDLLGDLARGQPNFLAAIRNLCDALPRSPAKPNVEMAIKAAAEIVALVRWQIDTYEGKDLVRDYAERED